MQGKIEAPSDYDPCDLFSGEPRRVRAALGALLDQPQNNLALFVGGRRQALAGQQPRAQQPQQQDAQPQLPPQQQQQKQGALEELLGGLLPWPAAARRGALVELLAAALEREGVLPRLLRAQQGCEYDIEGIHCLYLRLMGAQPDAVAAVAAEHAAAGAAGATEGTAAAREGHASQAEAMRQLLALPEAEAHAVLRAYVVSATAKDCAVMVALQRLAGPPPEAEAECARGSGGDPQQPKEQQHIQLTQHQGAASSLKEPPAGYLLLPEAPGSSSTNGSSDSLTCSGSSSASGGTWFRYRLCLVDLDLKPLAKIPAHAALDRRILAAARARLPAGGGSGEGSGSGSLAARIDAAAPLGGVT